MVPLNPFNLFNPLNPFAPSGPFGPFNLFNPFSLLNLFIEMTLYPFIHGAESDGEGVSSIVWLWNII